MRVVAREGDLTKSHATVIVNAGNTSLWLGSGVAGAIRTNGGPSIQKELDIISSVRSPHRVIRGPDGQPLRFPCEYGEVVVTHGGDLKARYVFHAAVMDSQGPAKGKTSAAIIRVATINCLLKGRELSVAGMTFPLFGTGVGGFPLKQAAEIMLSAIEDYGDADTLYRIYAYTRADFDIIAPLVKEYFDG